MKCTIIAGVAAILTVCLVFYAVQTSCEKYGKYVKVGSYLTPDVNINCSARIK